MFRRHPRWQARAVTLLFATAFPHALAAQAAQQSAREPLTRSAASESREQWQRYTDILTALAIDSGGRVADVGAGGGFYTERLAKRVGERGRVFAVEIDEQAIERLEQLVAAQSLRNVELVLGKADDPRLPYRSLDAALIVNAYHEMVRHGDMLREIYASLKPGGRLVILDNPPNDSKEPRYRQVEGHQIDIGLVEAELREAGFEVLSRDEEFVTRNHNGNMHRNWLLVARRPDGARSVKRI